MKKLLSFILALIFTCGVVGTSLAQQAAPAEEPAAAAEQAAPKKAKKAKKSKKTKKSKKAKKAAACNTGNTSIIKSFFILLVKRLVPSTSLFIYPLKCFI